MVAPEGGMPPASRGLVGAAARQLVAEGWIVRRIRSDAGAPWHVAAHRGTKWRVVQVLAPATGAGERQRSRVQLGTAAQIPSYLGSMELWHAHVRPGGYLTFGRDLLSGSAWGSDRDETHLLQRLGLDAPAIPG